MINLVGPGVVEAIPEEGEAVSGADQQVPTCETCGSDGGRSDCLGACGHFKANIRAQELLGLAGHDLIMAINALLAMEREDMPPVARFLAESTLQHALAAFRPLAPRWRLDAWGHIQDALSRPVSRPRLDLTPDQMSQLADRKVGWVEGVMRKQGGK